MDKTLQKARNFLMSACKFSVGSHQRDVELEGALFAIVAYLEQQTEQRLSAPTPGPVPTPSPSGPVSLEAGGGWFRLTWRTTGGSKSMSFTPEEWEATQHYFFTHPRIPTSPTTSGSQQAAPSNGTGSTVRHDDGGYVSAGFQYHPTSWPEWKTVMPCTCMPAELHPFGLPHGWIDPACPIHGDKTVAVLDSDIPLT